MGGDDGQHCAVLLAAGASTRLGQPKQLLTRDGVALVRRVALALSATQPRELLVVLGADAQRIAAVLEGIAHRVVTNPDPERGLAGSLRCAAAALEEHMAPVLIAACDQPALELRHLRELLDAARSSPVQAAATVHGDRLGIPAVVSGEIFANAPGAHADRGLGHWLTTKQGVARLDAPELTLDIDTPADLEQARERGLLD